MQLYKSNNIQNKYLQINNKEVAIHNIGLSNSIVQTYEKNYSVKKHTCVTIALEKKRL